MADSYETLFRRALLIRRVEEKIIELYPTDQIQSPVHLSIGQEAVSVAACASLQSDDMVFGSYRSHALYIAVGGDLVAMFSELMGRKGGLSKGKAGSMHLSAPAQGLMGSSAVVASHLPHAVGAAYAARLRMSGQTILCVFGDGSLEEGVAHESFNFAALHKLPVLFLCENNGLAVHSTLNARQAFKIENFAKLYELNYQNVQAGWDINATLDACQKAFTAIRNDEGPQFIEVRTFRYKEHVGTNDDFHYGYRSKEAYDLWAANDPLIKDVALRDKLLPGIDDEIEKAVKKALKSPEPNRDDLLTDVY